MRWKPKKSPRRRSSSGPSLRFVPTAWAKLRYLRDLGPTEIGGFGITAVDDPLLVVDFLTVRQNCTPITVSLNDEAVADLFDDLVDQGLSPERFGRLWLHTHPACCPLPSTVDEATFRRVFGRTHWAVMFILARNDATYARLAFHVGPGGELEIPVEVDYARPFAAADREAWQREYAANVVAVPPSAKEYGKSTGRGDSDALDWDPFYDLWKEEFDDGAPHGRPV